MKNSLLLLSFVLLIFFSKTVLAQEVADTPAEHSIFAKKVYKPFILTGRVLGVNLENVHGVVITNICTAETATTDGNGIYHIGASRGDTLNFEISKYSKEVRSIKSNENLNIIMIKRKTGNLPPGYSRSDYNKAKKEDDELYRILEKDAKLEDKWKY
jgi:hypothetical protein